jgi:hypothetical protein
MRFRIPRKTSAVLALLVVAALWLFGIWPLCTLGPEDACTTSPAQEVARYWDELTEAWAGVRKELCPDDEAPCIEPDEDWKPSDPSNFATMSRLLDQVTPGGLVPRVFAEPTVLRLQNPESLVLSWPAPKRDSEEDADDDGEGTGTSGPSSFRIGTLRLAGGASSSLQILYRRQPFADGDERPSCPATADEIAEHGLRLQQLAAEAAVSFAVSAASGASLVLCCTGAECRVEME